ncbi:MAG: hypothetical protein ACRDP8_21130 [Actinopolymorphaceae bacterium]
MNPLVRLAGWVGVVLLLPVLFLYAVSGLVAPVWAVVVLIGCWILLVLCAVRWVRRRPLVVLALPFVGVALWFGVISLGEALFGWTA